MKGKEAIDILRSDIHDTVPASAITARKHNEAIEIAISALEKQMAKPPIPTSTMLKCPSCKKIVMSKHYASEVFCKHCGQHIAEWGEC